MCTDVIVFLQEEKETIGMCTDVILQDDVIAFPQEEKETIDMCTDVIVFL